MLFSITYMEWAHIFPYMYTFHVSHFYIYIIISVFVNYAVKKGYKLLNISLFMFNKFTHYNGCNFRSSSLIVKIQSEYCSVQKAA